MNAFRWLLVFSVLTLGGCGGCYSPFRPHWHHDEPHHEPHHDDHHEPHHR